MPVNIDLADASNVLLVATLVLYALAMLAYACDFAFSRQRVLAGVETPVRVAVGAGGPAVAVPGSPSPGAGSGPAAGLWLRTAFGLTCLGVGCHVLAILARGLAEHRTPWGNMFEFLSAITCMAV